MIRRLLRLLRGLATMVGVLVAGTMIAAIVMVGVIWMKWDINEHKLEQIVAIAQGYDLAAMREEAELLDQVAPPEQPSFDQVIERRVMRDRDIELREQALTQALDEFRHKQRKQDEELRRFSQLREAFEEQLAQINEASVSAGMQENTIMLQNMKPAQAKDQLVQMYDNGEIDAVVRLVAGMNPSKRKRITGEFKTDEEEEKLGEILRRIREGYPSATLAVQTKEKLQQAAPTQP